MFCATFPHQKYGGPMQRKDQERITAAGHFSSKKVNEHASKDLWEGSDVNSMVKAMLNFPLRPLPDVYGQIGVYKEAHF